MIFSVIRSKYHCFTKDFQLTSRGQLFLQSRTSRELLPHFFLREVIHETAKKHLTDAKKHMEVIR